MTGLVGYLKARALFDEATGTSSRLRTPTESRPTAAEFAAPARLLVLAKIAGTQRKPT